MRKKIVIIGAGPGGYETALYAARNKMDVTLVESGEIGGTCLNRGCIPTKSLLAESLSGVFNRSDYERIVDKRESVIGFLKNSIESSLKKAGISLVSGHGEVFDSKTVNVRNANGNTKRINADFILLATGSKPIGLEIPGYSCSKVSDSDTIWTLKSLPATIGIIGGGVIGMEFATAFAALGIETTVIEYEKSILSTLDTDMVKRYKSFAKKQGIKIISGAKVESIEETDNSAVINYCSNNNAGSVEIDAVLSAVGRWGNYDREHFDKTGILHNNSYVTVGADCQTSIENVYAIGDINGISMLAHSAVSQGRQVIDYLIKNKPVSNRYIPACVFTEPEMAAVGMTETECADAGTEYFVEKLLYGTNGKAAAAGQQEGFVKMLVDRDGKLLGLHILGAHASDLIHYGVIAMEGGIDVFRLSDMVFAHPTLGELFLECTRNLKDRIGEKHV